MCLAEGLRAPAFFDGRNGVRLVGEVLANPA